MQELGRSPTPGSRSAQNPPPPGITGSFDPARVTALQSILTVSIGSSVAPGVYLTTIRASGVGMEDVQAQMPVEVMKPYARTAEGA